MRVPRRPRRGVFALVVAAAVVWAFSVLWRAFLLEHEIMHGGDQLFSLSKRSSNNDGEMDRAANASDAPRSFDVARARQTRLTYARRLDGQIIFACANMTAPPPRCAQGARVLQYNVFRMLERGTASMIGSWLAVRDYDYVSLNELNGFNSSGFSSWAREHGFNRAFLLEAVSGYHVGLVTRDPTCEAVERRVQGFAHGALRVRCGDKLEFIVTHLSPFDVKSRRHEAAQLAKMMSDAASRTVVLCGDLNSPPPIEPYTATVPRTVEGLPRELQRRLKRKFFPVGDATLDTQVANSIKAARLVDACAPSAVDGCESSVPTKVGADDSHALPMRLDFIYVSREASYCGAQVVKNALTEVLSDHFPLELTLTNHRGSSSIIITGGDERSLACGWAERLTEVYDRAEERKARVLREFGAQWDAEELQIGGVPFVSNASRWRPAKARPGESCASFCGRHDERGDRRVCVSETVASPILASCDRMTAVFGCPFGCERRRGAELPAYVHDADADAAGVCLLPSLEPPKKPVVRRPPLKKKKARRRLLVAPMTAALRKQRLAKSKAAREAAQAEQKLLASMGFVRDGRRPLQRSCEASHPSTQRLCACLDATPLTAAPLQSCAAACAPRKCDGTIQKNFDAHSCAYLNRTTVRANPAAGSSAQNVLPALLISTTTTTCLVNGGASLTKNKQPENNNNNNNNNNGRSCDATPSDPRIRRLCACSPQESRLPKS